MFLPEMHIREDVFDPKEKAATRDGFGKGIIEAADADARVLALTADLAESTRLDAFKEKFPERFIEVGVAEQNMITVAAGLATYGKIPFITSYATFSPGRNWEQIRTTACINDVPVKIAGHHAGLMTGADGATHEALEDLALMRVLPNMIVLSPADAEEARKATAVAAQTGTPVYLRFAREKTPMITTTDTPFAIGKANTLWRGSAPQAAIFATGPVLHEALLAAKQLESEGIAVSVTDVHTLKPLDDETIAREAAAVGAVVTVEEHQVQGGLGGAIAECLARLQPTPIEFIGVQNRFGQTGTPEQLWNEYGITAPHIAEAVKRVIARKRA